MSTPAFVPLTMTRSPTSSLNMSTVREISSRRDETRPELAYSVPDEAVARAPGAGVLATSGLPGSCGDGVSRLSPGAIANRVSSCVASRALSPEPAGNCSLCTGVEPSADHSGASSDVHRPDADGELTARNPFESVALAAPGGPPMLNGSRVSFDALQKRPCLG